MASETTALEVKVLCLLGWVDGKFDDAEHDASRALLDGTMEGQELQEELAKMGANLPVKKDVLEAVKAAPSEVSRKAIKSGFALARADGYLHEGELAILLELALAAGVPQADVERVGGISDVAQSFLELEKLF